MCGATYAPKVCLSCLMSDSRHSKIDVDVIQQMLGCLVNDAKKLKEDVNKILKHGKIDSSTRDAVLTVSANIGAIIDAGAKAELDSNRKLANASSEHKQYLPWTAEIYPPLQLIMQKPPCILNCAFGESSQRLHADKEPN
uniref:Uncharacterized protein n=1 Tax=Chenopodium quinoa TaxID=63459 RepID=A0A803LFH6_CHEQI